MEKIFRLYDFNFYNDNSKSTDLSSESGGGSSDGGGIRRDENKFFIQMFGQTEEGKSCSIVVEDFKPFFYVMVSDKWTIPLKNAFLNFIKKKIGKYYENSIVECKLIKRKKLYGFDGGKEHKFILFKFSNIQAYNKVKNVWYTDYAESLTGKNERHLLKGGFFYEDTYIQLYEASIPPLLRFFHIQNVSPSGWIAIPTKKLNEIKYNKKTTCDYEYTVKYNYIVPLNEKEDRVPLKICSFDIEASSSHGDFPIPVKSYKKLATQIIDYFDPSSFSQDKDQIQIQVILKKIIMNAFGFSHDMSEIELVYPKQNPKSEEELIRVVEQWFVSPIRNDETRTAANDQMSIESMFEKMNQSMNQQYGEDGENGHEDGEGNGEENQAHHYYTKTYTKYVAPKKGYTVLDLLADKKMDRSNKITEMTISFKTSKFPDLEGDKVTFIGSTFLRLGDKDPYLNHCVVLNSCGKVENAEIETFHTEKDLLLGWRDIIQKENPDIIIGYNIFGFDYEFMFRRSEETDCVEEFLKLSKNRDEICGTRDLKTNRYNIEETSIHIASGQHDLKYIKMSGRIQIDLYNFFRREENLSSYKLDYVAGHFIGDYVKSNDYDATTHRTTIKTTNVTGLLIGSFIHFEEIGHSVDYYNDGEKFPVLEVFKADKEKAFTIAGKISPDTTKKVRWCLAKDDVTPKDIFRMTNGSAEDRAIIAKYCIQDCNLVHYLMNKVDVWTGFSEMAKICSVPINFLVLRGQGIKLTSYVAKKCREKGVLMPVMDKSENEDGYEGAIVLDPKCDLYLDNPVACVDYASLYPSSMMSENISHDSKVWTMEYNLKGELVEETGDKIGDVFIYDNLPGHEYVNITYDTFKYERKTPSAAAQKIKCGYKICRFAQPIHGQRAIMPSILEELLMSRKATRKLIPLETDDFMKNVLDKRQLGYKLTANSLYGQCGAKTSTFYDKDCAASTTATGRLLLTYAKKVVEECYQNTICDTTRFGPVLTQAEYIYGDSVASYTPSTFRHHGWNTQILTMEEVAKDFGQDKWVVCKEPGKQTKEYCELNGVEVWTDQGWTQVRVIMRHKLAAHKKMIRIMTDTGLVDVTDDHSLLLPDGKEVSPKDVQVGTELLHKEKEARDGIIMNNEMRNELYFNHTHVSFDINHEQKEAANYFRLLATQCYPFKIYEIKGRIHFKLKYTIQEFVHASEEDKKPCHAIRSIQEIPYKGYVYDLTTKNHHFAAGVGNIIVHNTDSVFFTFNLATPEGVPIRGKDALEITIELAQQAGHLASTFLKGPHDLEYEKTFMPFCLLSKKRYVGMLYETDPTKCKRKEMGIVLKRRDNAPIVKEIYGGIIDILMKQQDIGKAADFLRGSLRNIVDEKYPIEKLIISKSLRTGYKNPKSIAHKVLADRMTARDPGSKPSSGDRIPYVYIHNPSKKALQGEKIETPTFIRENNLKIDYSFYITNQIMKPVQQVFALVLEKMWDMQNKKSKIVKFRKEIETLKSATPEDKYEDKLENLKNKEVKALLFDEFLRETTNSRENNQSISNFFGKK